MYDMRHRIQNLTKLFPEDDSIKKVEGHFIRKI